MADFDRNLIFAQIQQDADRLRDLVNGDENVLVDLEARTVGSIQKQINDALVIQINEINAIQLQVEGDRDTAVAAKDDALSAKNKAEEWAENNEDVEVETGQFSAKHHAIKASASASAANQSAQDASSSETSAGQSASAALSSEQAAEGAKDTAVSAAQAASQSEANAGQSATQAAQSASDAEQSALNASNSESAASDSASNAQDAVTTVSNLVTQATDSASAASQSEANAQASAEDALGYSQGLEEARDTAVDAADRAETAADNVDGNKIVTVPGSGGTNPAGSVYNKDVQTDLQDATAGKVALVGSFGGPGTLELYDIQKYPLADLDADPTGVPAGAYYISENDTSNLPFTGTAGQSKFGSVKVEKSAGTRTKLTAISAGWVDGSTLTDAGETFERFWTSTGGVGWTDPWVRTDKVITSTGTQPIAEALDDRLAKDERGLQSAETFIQTEQSLADSDVVLITKDFTYSDTLSISEEKSLISFGKTIVRNAVSRASGIVISAKSSIKNLKLNMLHSENSVDGQGIQIAGGSSVMESIVVENFGTNDTSGAGTGIVSQSGTVGKNIRISNAILKGDPLATLAFGWIYSNDTHSFADNIYVENVSRYAHELKNDAQYNVLHSLITDSSQQAVALGQQGGDGADRNLVFGSLSSNTDNGVVIGFGNENLFTSAAYHAGSTRLYPDYTVPDQTGIRIRDANNNVITDHLLTGPYDFAVKIDNGNSNFVSFANYQSGGGIRLTGASEGNFINVMHPGDVSSIIPLLSRSGGWGAYAGPTANVVHCPATGERLGSLSGVFRDRLSSAGSVTPSSSHGWYREASSDNLEAIMTRGNNGTIAGETFMSPGGDDGRIWYTYGTTSADDFYQIGVGGQHRLVEVYTDKINLNRLIRMNPTPVGSLPLASSTGVGYVVYCTDGDSGDACLAVCDGTSWRRVSLGAVL